jgi:adenylate cyclase
VKKGGQLVRECTVFNSDIRGFTPMSEGRAPELLVEMLNEYFELMVETVFKYEARSTSSWATGSWPCGARP